MNRRPLCCTVWFLTAWLIGALACDEEHADSSTALGNEGGARDSAASTASRLDAATPTRSEGVEFGPPPDALTDAGVPAAAPAKQHDAALEPGSEPKDENVAATTDASATQSPEDATAKADAALDAGSVRAATPDAGIALGPLDAGASLFIVEPSFVQNDNPAAPLVGVLRFQTIVDVATEVTVVGGDEQWSLSLPSGSEFEYPIVGLQPATNYTLELAFEVDGVQLNRTQADPVSTEGSAVFFGPLEWTTPSLPTDFPPLTPVISRPLQMEPGMTMFNGRIGGGETSFLIVVDHEGAVRWFYRSPTQPVRSAAEHLENGNFLFGYSTCAFAEVDVRGYNVTAWYAEEQLVPCDEPQNAVAVPAARFHHEIQLLDNGNLLTLGVELRDVEDLPTSEDDPLAPRGPATIMGSVVMEFTREGEMLEHISIADLLDTSRIGRDSLDAVDGFVEEQIYDWDHANAVVYEKASDSYYVSLRHQDAIIKIDRGDETLTWILGPPSNWRQPWSDKLLQPVGDLIWQYHQHAVEVTPFGIGLYDNGNYRAGAFEAPQPPYGRAVIYSVDDANLTVSQLWSYGAPTGPEYFFSPLMGDADWQPETQNILITNGQLSAGTSFIGQILEVTLEGERLFQLDVGAEGQTAEDATRHSSYRAERIVDLRQLTFTASGQASGRAAVIAARTYPTPMSWPM